MENSLCSASNITWSYTALTAFETCPRRYYLTRVSKEVEEPQNEAAKWGSAVHEALERRLRNGDPLPVDLAKYEPLMRRIESAPGRLLTEQQLAVTSSWEPTEWLAEDTWCRGIIDVARVGRSTAVVLDYKTGKRKPDSDQLRLFALLVFAHYPYVERVNTAFLWLKYGEIDSALFTRENIPWLKKEFGMRVQRLVAAYEQDRWPARPSGLCRAWCPAGRSRCEFCGQP